MSAGIIGHVTHTRDIRRLGGLRRVMPVTAALAIVAAAAMAGVPLLNGFVSKEMMLDAAWQMGRAGWPWLIPLLATLGALLSAACSARLIFHVFLGKRREATGAPGYDPPWGMWLPVALLLIPVVALGVLPALAAPLVMPAAAAAAGGEVPVGALRLWHGATPALLMSLVALLGAVALLARFKQINRLRRAVPRADAMRLFQWFLVRGVHGARALLRSVDRGSLPLYLAIIVVTILGVCAVGYRQAGGADWAGGRATLPVNVAAVTGWILLLLACVLVILRHHDRLLALILTSVVGLVVSLVFLQFSAPDLALTQISVEVMTTLLLLLAINLLPRTTPRDMPLRLRLGAGALALAGGAGVAALAYAVMTRGFDTISGFYLDHSQPGGGGTNVVNVILVDFRGYDTFGEIIVLAIAALSIFALLDAPLRRSCAPRLPLTGFTPRSGDPHPLLLGVAARVLLPLALMVGAYILLRGHNQPGGGFIAGLVVAIALLMQYMASGHAWAHHRARIDAHGLIGAGVLVAGATGLAALFFAQPFLTSTFGHLGLPLFGDVELASAMAFDLGVFLVVVGTCLLSLATLSRSEGGTP